MALTRIKTDQVLDGTILAEDLHSAIAINTSGNITTSGDVSAANITMTGELNGPATFYIDPAPHDPDTDGATNGLVVIRGDLQVDGTTTTVNSTTMDVADLNITLASGAANSAAADGAGFTIDGASVTFNWDDTNTRMSLSTDLNINGAFPKITLTETDNSDTYSLISQNFGYLTIDNDAASTDAGHGIIFKMDGVESNRITQDKDFTWNENNGGTPQVGMHWDYADGSLGIGTTSPGNLLHVKSDVNNGAVITVESTATDSYPFVRLKNDAQEYQITAHGPLGDKFTIYDGTAGSHRFTINTSGKVGINTTAPDALLHVSDTSPHIDIGPQGGNRGKIGYHDLDVIIGSTSSTGEIIFKNNIGSTDAPQTSGDVKMVIGDTNVGIGVETPESRLTVGTNAITTLKPTAVFVDGSNGGAVTIRGLSPTLAFDKTGTDASARILLDGGALQFRDGDLDATDPNQSNPVTSNLLMVLSHDGKLGIGNFGDGNTAPYYIDPSYQLHVKGAGDIKIEDDTGGSAHLRIGASTSGTRDSEWKVKVYGSADEFHIDHDYTASGTAVTEKSTAFKIDGKNNLYNDNYQPVVKPTLNFDFASTKTLDPRVIFYRDSIATYYDKNGILRTATQNEPRFNHFGNTGLGNAAHECKGLLIEEERTNEINDLLSYFNDVEYSAIISKNAGVSPDGKYNAYKFTINSGTTAGGVRKLYRFGLNTSSFHSISVFVKNVDADSARVNWGDNGQSGSVQAQLNFSTGELVTTGSSSWLPEGTLDVLANGWYRIKLAFYLPAGASSTTVPHITILGSTQESVFIYGPQIEINTVSLSASSYIPNEQTKYFRTRASQATFHKEDGSFSTAVVDAARYAYKYNGKRWIETGLVLEGSATNKIHQNSIPSGAYQSTNSYNKTAPDGTNDAFQNIPTSGRPIGGAACVIWSGTAFSNTTDQHTVSIYAKGVNGFDRIRLYDNNNNKNAYFNLTGAGSFDTVNTDVAHIEYVGDGWYRCGMTYVPAVNTSPYFQIYSGNVGDGSGGYHFWGAQAESGTEMSSYIYTTSADVTRAADVAVDNLDITRAQDTAYIELEDDWWNYEEGTFYVKLINGGGNPRLMYASNDTSNQRMGIYVSSNNPVRFLISDDGTSVDTNSVNSYHNAGDEISVAAGFANADVAVSDNGATPVTSTSAAITIPQKMTKLYIGGYYNGVPEGSSHIKKFSYYAERLANDQLRALSEND